MKPKLPNRASQDVNLIRRDTWNAVLDCLAYAMEHPRGDGTTILNLGDGNLQARQSYDGGQGGGDSTGMFTLVESKNQNGNVQISVIDTSLPDGGIAGIALVNGRSFQVASAVFPCPAAGTSYVVLHFRAEGILAEAALLADLPLDGSAEEDGASVAIELLNELPNSDFSDTYWLLGRVVIANETCRILQDHRPGLARLEWYGDAIGVAEEYDWE